MNFKQQRQRRKKWKTNTNFRKLIGVKVPKKLVESLGKEIKAENKTRKKRGQQLN